MLRKIGIIVSVLLGLSIIAVIVWTCMIVSAFGGFEKDYSVTELKENYSKNKTEIQELKKHFNEIVGDNRFVEIEYENDESLFRFGIEEFDSNRPKFLEWNLKTNSAETDSIINSLGWTRKTLKTLKMKLDKADCIQIESGEPTKVGFKRCGMGMYSFNIFDFPISEKTKKQYNDSCTHIIVDEDLILEYGSGAIGSQCFYNLK